MPRFFGKIDKIELVKGKLTKKIEEALAVGMRNAAREFVRAVLINIPVQTGEAAGALIPLGRMLRVAIPIRPTRSQAGKNPSTGAEKSSYKFVSKYPKFTFEFEAGVIHYTLNEFGLGVGPYGPDKKQPPWNTFGAGKAAFLAYLERNKLLSDPKIIEDSTVRTSITFGRRHK